MEGALRAVDWSCGAGRRQGEGYIRHPEEVRAAQAAPGGGTEPDWGGPSFEAAGGAGGFGSVTVSGTYY